MNKENRSILECECRKVLHNNTATKNSLICDVIMNLMTADGLDEELILSILRDCHVKFGEMMYGGRDEGFHKKFACLLMKLLKSPTLLPLRLKTLVLNLAADCIQTCLGYIKVQHSNALHRTMVAVFLDCLEIILVPTVSVLCFLKPEVEQILLELKTTALMYTADIDVQFRLLQLLSGGRDACLEDNHLSVGGLFHPRPSSKVDLPYRGTKWVPAKKRYCEMEIFGLEHFPVTVPLVVILLVLLYMYGSAPMSTWSNLGIPGPKPTPFIGNMGSFRKQGLLGSLKMWKSTYGSTYGIYITRQPVLVTSDQDILKEVLVKQFNNFADRNALGAGLVQESIARSLFFVNGDDWRRYRSLMTPAFTSGKLKMGDNDYDNHGFTLDGSSAQGDDTAHGVWVTPYKLMDYMIKCSHSMVSVLKEKADKAESVDLKDVCSRFTLDVIAATAFGLEVNTLLGKDNEQQLLVQAMKNIVSTNVAENTSRIIAGAFPILRKPLQLMGYTTFPKPALNTFYSCLKTVVRQRDEGLKESQKRIDFIQQLLNLRLEETQPALSSDTDNCNVKYKSMTEDEIISQGLIVFIAGFETTASTLRFLTYSVARYPDVQEKIYREIQEVIGNDEVSYDKLARLTYLDCVIHETLRMYTPLPVFGRLTAETVTIKGVTFPKGTAVMIPVYLITHDPENYPDPDVFRPERFEENHDTMLSALPFGFGPRQCIGMRLALQEIKVVLVHIFRNFRLIPCDTDTGSIQLGRTVLLSTMVPLTARFVVRSHA